MKIESISNLKSGENHNPIENPNIIEIEIKDKKYQLEISKSNFEYPERIQKETGIISYERTKISSNSLFEIIKNEASSILDEVGIKTQEDLLKMYEFYSGVTYDKKDKSKVDWDQYHKIGKIEKIILGINKKILKLLSDGEYPDLCYTHRIAAYTDRSALMNQQLKEDRFFLQKIYDQNRVEKNDTNYGFGNNKSSYSLYNDNGLLLKKWESVRGLPKQRKIKDNTAFAAMPNGGLNFWMGDFWGRFEQDLRSTTFGIPFHSDSFQEEYIKKSLETFCKIEKNELKKLSRKDNVSENPEIVKNFQNFRGINGPIIIYALNEYIKNHPDYITKYKDNIQKFHFKNLALEEPFIKEFGDIINNFLIDNNITLEDNSYNIKALLQMLDWGEVNLPVFINHKELPQVSWGYAKYAHYVNEQGLNFIKLKHADHLPSSKT